MVTRLEVYKLALRELVNQWQATGSASRDITARLQKDIQYVAERVVELEREYAETCKINM